MENVKGQLTQWINKAEQSSNQLVGQIDLASNMAEMLDYTDRVFLAADNDYRAKNFTPELTQVQQKIHVEYDDCLEVLWSH